MIENNCIVRPRKIKNTNYSHCDTCKTRCNVIFCLIAGVVLARRGGMIQQLYFPFFLGLGGPVGAGTQVCNLNLLVYGHMTKHRKNKLNILYVITILRSVNKLIFVII